jgi:hypothetical protein
MIPQPRHVLLFYFFLLINTSFASQYADFSKCTNYVRSLTSAACTSPDFHCTSSDRRPLLTLPGCKRVCGSGFDPDKIEDVFSRFFLWLLPVIILAAHFHFPPLGWKNIIATTVSIAGNPVGCLWSLLTRHEVFRRAYRRANAAGFGKDTAADIATIAAACDEFGWHDPLEVVFLALRKRMRVEEKDKEENGEKTKEQKVIANASDPLMKAAKHEGPDAQCGLFLDQIEEYYIACARQELVSYRHDSQLATWFAIVGLVGAVIAAFFRVWMSRDKPFSTRTVPMVIMTFHLLAIVQLSGTLGAFTSILGPLDALHKLQRRLDNHYVTHDIPEDRRLDFASKISCETDSTSAIWLKKASYTGMNPTWRPDKHLKVSDIHLSRDRSPAWLLAYSLLFVSISVAAAICHSFFQIGNFGFGCRCLTWSLIGLSWLGSLGADQLLQYTIKRPGIPQREVYRRLWLWTAVKDGTVSTCVAITTLCMHIGMTSTCYCYTGTLFGGKFINLWPLTQDQERVRWIQLVLTPLVALILICILLVVLQYDKNAATLLNRTLCSRTLLCPDREERHRIMMALEQKRIKLTQVLADTELNRTENVWEIT